MIDFQRLPFSQKERYESILFAAPPRGSEYTFANLHLWGRQLAAESHGCMVFFSHFNGHSVYPYPIGSGDRRAAVEAVLADARERGIPCRFAGMTQGDVEELEALFPGQFHFRPDRHSYDYVYDIHALADLKGKTLQKKRNHRNRFHAQHPDCRVVPLDECIMPRVMHMVNEWYRIRMAADPEGNYLLENIAMTRVFRHYQPLGMEGIALVDQDQVLAVTMGSPLSPDTFDIHFEKALEDVDGAYAAVNSAFACWLRDKYPQLRYLNREEDLGKEGLRQAKLSYHPHHLVEKHWAYLRKDIYDD